MDQAPKRFDIGDYASAFRKRKWLIVGVTLAALFVGFGITRVTEPMYRAEAVLLVKGESRTAFLMTGEPTRLQEDVSLDTETVRAQTMSLAQAAAVRYQEEVGTARPAHLIARHLHQSLSARAQEPNIIHLQSTANDRDDAIRYANAAAKAFKDAHTTKEEAAEEYVRGELVEAERTLISIENEIADYERQHGIIDPESDTTDAVDTLSRYRTWRAEAEAERSAAEATASALKKQLANEQPTEAVSRPVPSPALEEIDKLLGEKEAALAEARARYREEHPAVQDLVAEVAELRTERERRGDEKVERTEHVDNPVYAELRAQAADWGARAAGLTRRVDVVDRILKEHIAAIKDLPGKQADLKQLLAKREIALEAYRTLLQRHTEVTISKHMKEPKVEVLDEAVAAAQIAPRTTKTMVFALLVGLLSSLGLALVLELTDVTIHSPEDLQGDLAVPFLGMVPLMDDRSDDHLVTAKAPKSPPAEAYRTLRSNINFSLLDEPAKTILITSAGAGEGKSMTAANLAVTMAQAGRSVLLVDTDMRRPELHRFLDNDSAPGLTNALAGEASLSDIVHDTRVPNLRLVPSGPPPPNPAELLSSEKMGELLQRLSKEADVCILDSPPVLAVTDAMILASRADRTLLVAESGRVTKHAFRETKRLIQNARGNILGVVINKMRPSASDYYYYYYYYYDERHDGGDRAEGGDSTR